MRLGLDRALFAAITRQPGARGIVVQTGTLVNVTLIASASVKADKEARWAGHRQRKPVHGFKAYIATDQDAELVHGVELTTANMHDTAELVAILPDQPGAVYGDSAYFGRPAERVILARCGVSHTV